MGIGMEEDVTAVEQGPPQKSSLIFWKIDLANQYIIWMNEGDRKIME